MFNLKKQNIMTRVKFKRPNVLFPSIMDDFRKDFPSMETAVRKAKEITVA